MDPNTPYYIAIGTISASVIAAIALFTNSWLTARREKKKWVIEKKEKAYLRCLHLLNVSRRVPFHYDGEDYLERDSYNGLMAGIPHVTAWMTMMQKYSSYESVEEIRPVCDKITGIVRELKAHEREITKVIETIEVIEKLPSGEQNMTRESKTTEFVKERGISQAIEDALPVVITCLRRELPDLSRCWVCNKRR